MARNGYHCGTDLGVRIGPPKQDREWLFDGKEVPELNSVKHNETRT
jgi:hypothetical protein